MAFIEYGKTSKTQEWVTPDLFFAMCDLEFGPFDVDVCATKENAKTPLYFSKKEDGLKQNWQGRVWMNPPYERGMNKWIAKAYASSLAGATVVCLLPVRTDTAYFHDYCMKGEVRFLRGRLKFNSGAPARFPNMLVIFRPKND